MNPTPDYSQLPHKSHKAIIGDVILLPLLIAALAFGYWAYTGRQDYKNNSDKKSATAVAIAKEQQAAELQKQFDEQSKSPFKVFKGSPTYGTISFNYPKSWSAYVDNSNTTEAINAYFHPNEVPGIQQGVAYALRVELVDNEYSSVLQQFNSQVQQGKVTSKAYMFPKMVEVKNVLPGTRLDGLIDSSGKIKGAMVIMKVRDKTLKIYTQSVDFLPDFNNTVLTSLTFSP